MYAIVYVTTGDMEKAKTISRMMVEEGLAACANLYPIHSIYRWKGKVESNDEVSIMFKTKEMLVDMLVSRVKKVHDYELPCIVSWKIGKGSQEYMDWIGASVRKVPSLGRRPSP